MRGFSPCQGRFSPGSLFGHSSSPCCQRCIVENAPISNSKTKLHVDTAYHVRTGKYQIEHSSKFGVAGLPSLYSFACLPALIPPEQQSNKNVRNGTLFDVSSRWVAYSVSVLASFSMMQQHTKSCTSCMGALKRVNQGLPAAKAAAVASLVWVRALLCVLF